MKDKVDIFIPVCPSHFCKLKAAVLSALSQTYHNTRIVVYFDGFNEKVFNELELDKLFKQHKIVFEVDLEGPRGNGYFARQWYFDWELKAPYMKNLDADDIINPNCITTMMTYMNEHIDAVLCPIMMFSSNRYYQIIPGFPKPGHAGSGSFLFSRRFIMRLKECGWSWPNLRDHDTPFLKFLEENEEKFSLITTKETGLYFYLK